MELNTDQPLDLAASLESGQAHRWEREGQWYCGVVRGNVIKLRQTARCIEFRGGPRPEISLLPLLHSYFRLDDDICAIYAEIGRDQQLLGRGGPARRCAQGAGVDQVALPCAH